MSRPQLELLSLRPAPLQLTYMGHPGTSGAAYIQYVAVDPTVAPPRLARHFSERLLQLPQWHVTDYRYSHAFEVLKEGGGGLVLRGEVVEKGAEKRSVAEGLAMARRDLEGGPSSRTAKWPSVLSRRDAALPDEVPVFASFNQLYKVTPKYFQAWANALRRVGDARLWYLEFPRTAAKNLRLQAAAAGVRVGRLHVSGTTERRHHLARVTLADLSLDTGPYNGHTSAGDATWMGVVGVSVLGGMMQSRVAASYAVNAGGAYTVVRSMKEYEDAVERVEGWRLETARQRLKEMRWRSAAFDTEGWVEAFGRGVVMMNELERWKLKPMHLVAEGITWVSGS